MTFARSKPHHKAKFYLNDLDKIDNFKITFVDVILRHIIGLSPPLPSVVKLPVIVYTPGEEIGPHVPGKTAFAKVVRISIEKQTLNAVFK